ncbi:hypothetical protein [Metabacillus sp. RGM 3146]|uniref:hypothetical protein n=1 Tax=Metabacillus sp. RGM 3146 TaxID=3401092 RepID=UPI003B9B5001
MKTPIEQVARVYVRIEESAGEYGLGAEVYCESELKRIYSLFLPSEINSKRQGYLYGMKQILSELPNTYTLAVLTGSCQHFLNKDELNRKLSKFTNAKLLFCKKPIKPGCYELVEDALRRRGDIVADL